LMSGYALQFGFWNGIFGALLLVCAWIVWETTADSPLVGSALQSLAALALLVTWPPLALLPAALFCAQVVAGRAAHLALRGRRLGAWLIGPLLGAAYAVTVTWRDLRENPGGLAGEGAHFTPRLASVVMVFLIMAAAALIAWALRARSRTGVGVIVLIVASAVAMAYLLRQRVDSTIGLWGYYPAKFGWLVAFLAVLLTMVAVVSLVRVAGPGRGRRSLVAVAAALVAATAMSQIPPSDPRPPSPLTNPAPRPAPDWRVSTIFPVLSVAQDDGAADFDDAAEVLFRVSDPRDKVLVSRYFEDPFRDRFANFWLLQQAAKASTDAIRTHSYYLEAHDPASMCEAIRAWGGGVRVLTRAADWERRLRARCPRANFSVEVL
jgi:hypothetical protein